MKKTLFIILFLVFTYQIFSQTIVTGTWNRYGDKVSLFEVENGKLKEIATSVLSPEKEFAFAFSQKKPGFYLVGTSLLSPSNNYVFYFNPGNKLSVAVDEDSYKLSGENTPQNKDMERWHNLILPLEMKAYYFMKTNSNYVDFFPQLEEKMEEIDVFTPNYSTDPVFNKAFEKYRQYDLQAIAFNFLNTPRSAHPQGEDMLDFYNEISLSQITKDLAILDFPYGMRLIDFVRRYNAGKIQENATEEEKKKIIDASESLRLDLPNLTDAKVKGEVVLETAQNIKTYPGLTQFNDEFGKYLATENQKERMHKLLVDKAELIVGQDAFNFKFKDVNGKEVALSDFKGKLVYIDVWATWCGPCIKEIPSLKKLEADYHGKNIEFLGVSVDAVKDYEKWKNFLVKEELVGVQLFAGEKREDIDKPYKIVSIPRFILVGKDGKIISDNAPRPSSTEIRVLLDASLTK